MRLQEERRVLQPQARLFFFAVAAMASRRKAMVSHLKAVASRPEAMMLMLIASTMHSARTRVPTRRTQEGVHRKLIPRYDFPRMIQRYR